MLLKWLKESFSELFAQILSKEIFHRQVFLSIILRFIGFSFPLLCINHLCSHTSRQISPSAQQGSSWAVSLPINYDKVWYPAVVQPTQCPLKRGRTPTLAVEWPEVVFQPWHGHYLDYQSILSLGVECVEGDELNIVTFMLLSQADHVHSITSQKAQIFQSSLPCFGKLQYSACTFYSCQDIVNT